jgi:serine/threonine protein kinase
MSTKIGHFEILSELSKSDSGCVYKASDPESGQTLALKTIRLDVFGEHADEVVQRILQEAESTKDLSSSNITLVYGAGEIDGQFCAAMEYIQGNSVATMLARKEGFSIWDLLDISRQVCQGLDHAHQHNVFHISLEPAKVMVTWDGTVKILSFGISSTGYVAAGATGAPPSVLHYMSPEQVRGETLDARSNLFTWGAMLYEMVSDRKAFDGTDADVVRQKILEEMPTPPFKLNPKINAAASEVIMRALAKDPAERYQSGRDMVSDLEKCRESSGKTAKKAEPPQAPAGPDKIKAAAATKFAPPAAPRETPATSASKVEPKPPGTRFSEPVPSRNDELETSWTPPAPAPAKPTKQKAVSVTTPVPSENQAAAAAAGWSYGAPGSGTHHLDPSAQFVTSVVKASVEALHKETANMSSAVLDEPVVEKPKIAVDPLMAERTASSRQGVSFSDLAELPPLKEVYVASPRPTSETPVEQEALPSIILRRSEPEKPKVQPREVAEKAFKEIKSVPPKLMLYSIAAAVALILVIVIGVFWHSHSQNTDEDGGPVTGQPASTATRADASPQPQASARMQSAAQEEAPPQPTVRERAPGKPAALAAAKSRNPKSKKGASPAPTAIPGQLTVDSTPQGAQVQIDGRLDPSWLTPCTLTALAPGPHTIVVSKSGYGQETRTADVASASRASLSVHLNALSAAVMVSSDPVGALIFVDGKDTLRVTPSQITLEKGTHTVLVRKPGYLDETTSATAQPGQTFHFLPTLRPLGNADQIKTVGKFKRLFGGNGAQAGMGKVSIKTLPKGAQIAVNRRMLEKATPTEFLLNPGNYIVDITLTGYKPVQKVITVDRNGNLAIDETLESQ